MLGKIFGIIVGRPYSFLKDGVKDLGKIRDIPKRLGDGLFPQHVIGGRVFLHQMPEHLITFRDEDGVEILILTEIVDHAQQLDWIHLDSFQVVVYKDDSFFLKCFGVLDLRFDGEHIHHVHGNHDICGAAGQGVHSVQRGVKGGQKTAALFLGFMELPENRGADFEPFLPDETPQCVGIRYSEQRDLDNDMRFLERSCQVFFNQIGLAASPFAREQQGTDRIIFVAVVNEFVQCAQMVSSFGWRAAPMPAPKPKTAFALSVMRRELHYILFIIAPRFKNVEFFSPGQSTEM